MSKLNRLKSGTALMIALGLTTGVVTPIVAPLVAPSPVHAQNAQNASFSDVSSSYWARNFIQALAAQDIIAGFPDGTFRPESPVTRAQFAAMIRKAFNKSKSGSAVRFADVPSNYWAKAAIRDASEMGFLRGYPGNIFRPDQKIPREQVLVSLSSGLNYSANGSTADILGYYNDASNITGYAEKGIAAATEKGLVVDYPNVTSLNPTRNATRAEVAAFIYQALVNSGRAQAIESPYIVAQTNTTPQPPVATDFRIPSGTTIPVRYNQKKILVAPNEKVPLTLTVDRTVRTSNGTVIIPAGSQIVGELQPVQGGTQFVAQNLVMPDNRQMSINGTSDVVTKTETITKGANVGTIIRDAALGSAAAAGIAGVTGNRHITPIKVLGGTVAGSLLGVLLDRNKVDLISIDPNTDLNVTLNQDLTIGTRSPVATNFRIPSGATIPVRYNQKKILVAPNEKVPLTLTVDRNVRTSNGTVLIPAGSQIVGELEPVQGGTQFVAQNLVMPDNRQMSINGTSDVVTKTETITKGANVGTIIRDAALGSAAAAGIAGVTGNRHITPIKVLGGTVAGSLLGVLLDRNKVDLISIDPNTDLNVTLNQDLTIGTR